MINDILNEKTTENDNTYVETPKFIRFKKAVLNPRSNDNKSFQYSITLSSYYKEISNNFNRTANIEPYINNFNWNNINFPPIKQDNENFEISNENCSLNIYELDNGKICQLYKSNHNRQEEINLLLLKNKHCVSIKNLKSLLN